MDDASEEDDGSEGEEDEGGEGEDEEDEEEEEEEGYDARSIRSFESMMSSRSGKKKKTKKRMAAGPGGVGRKSLTDRLASMPGLSRLSQSGQGDSNKVSGLLDLGALRSLFLFIFLYPTTYTLLPINR